MSSPFRAIANRLASLAGKAGSITGRINGIHDDLARLGEQIAQVYRGTSGGASLALQVDALTGTCNDMRRAVQRLEADLRQASARAMGEAGTESPQ